MQNLDPTQYLWNLNLHFNKIPQVISMGIKVWEIVPQLFIQQIDLQIDLLSKFISTYCRARLLGGVVMGLLNFLCLLSCL